MSGDAGQPHHCGLLAGAKSAATKVFLARRTAVSMPATWQIVFDKQVDLQSRFARCSSASRGHFVPTDQHDGRQESRLGRSDDFSDGGFPSCVSRDSRLILRFGHGERRRGQAA
jgi:hypothetical protein